MLFRKPIRDFLHNQKWSSLNRDQLRALFSVHTMFYGYRWLAWLVAGGLLLTSEQSSQHPHMVWLLIVTGVLALLSTILAKPYIRVVVRLPLLLALDILANVVVLWLCQGKLMPFFPFALSSLVLPSLLFGWHGGVVAAVTFIVLDNAGLTIIGAATFESFPYLAGHLVAPLVFVILWSWFLLLIRKDHVSPVSNALRLTEQFSVPGRNTKKEENLEPIEPFTFIQKITSFASQNGPDMPMPSESGPVTAAEPEQKRIVIQQTREHIRNVVYRRYPDTEHNLAVALEQLTKEFSQHSGITVAVKSSGTMQSLSPVYYITLFRFVQEALLNIQQHAQAHSATLMLNCDAKRITIAVHDDGVGLIGGTHHRAGMHALRAMHYRFAEIDGKLEVFEEDGSVMVRGSAPLE